MKIGIAGAFSTGKTTLAKNLYNNLPEGKDGYVLDINPERIIAKQMNFDFRKATEKQIKKYQERLYDYLVSTNSKVNKLITDTPLVVSSAYAIDDKLADICIKKSAELYDILFYIPHPCTPLVDDGVRHCDKDYRIEIDEKIRDALVKVKGLNDKIGIFTLTGFEEEDKLKEALHIIKLQIKYEKRRKFVKKFLDF